MGKKSKKDKKKTTYSKTQFVDIICEQCGLCELPEPDFCYSDIYKKEQTTFIRKVYPKIATSHKEHVAKFAYKTMADYSDEKLKDLFVNCVCRTDACIGGSEDCGNIAGCMMTFRKQTMDFRPASSLGENTSSDHNHVKRKSKAQKGEKFILEAYPTFFCSDGIRKEIAGATSNQDAYGNSKYNVEQQDHCIRITAEPEVIDNKQTTFSESDFLGC